MRKIELLAILLILVAVGVLSWISFGPFEKKPKEVLPTEVTPTSALETAAGEEAVSVRIIKVSLRNFEDMLPVLGTVKGYLEIPLKFEVNGVIKTLEVREGDRVKKGEVIAALKDEDAQLRLQYSKKKLESAKAQYLSASKKKELYEGLYKAGAVIKQKLEEATLEAEAVKSQEGMAQAEIEIAEAELNKTRLLSPKDGVIGTKDVEVGEFVTSQNKIVALYDLEKVYIEIGVVEKDIEKVRIGQKVEVQLDSYPDKLFLGKVENLLPVIEGKSRTLTAKVLLDNPEGLLLPGMFSRAKIYIVELINALIVPKTSILSIGPGINIAPIINPGDKALEDIEKGVAIGTVELRKVTVGYAGSDYSQIIEGLKAGDMVIIETRGELKDGLKVKVVGIEEMVI